MIDFKELHDNLEKLGNEITLQNSIKAALQKQGIINANVHFKDEKYMFLMHPQVDGERKKEYIGSKKTKQNAVLKAVERYKTWKEVCNLLEKLEHRCDRLERQYRTFCNNLDPQKRMESWYGF